MESVLSTTDQQRMISSFLEIAVGQSAETARQFLQATSWKLEEAIQLFYVGGELGGIAPPVAAPTTDVRSDIPAKEPVGSGSRVVGEHDIISQIVGDEVRAPLPVRREVLYDDAAVYFRPPGVGHPPTDSGSVVAFRNFDEEMKRPGVWETDRGATSTADTSRDNLASLYRPPFQLMFRGSFEKAKGTSAMQDKWLLVNLQSNREFSSHMLNRDTWANDAVAQTISSNFIFWQVYDDTSEGSKVSTYYKLDSYPAVLVIDPITGQKMRSWVGMIQPDSLLEDLLPFMDGGPKDHHVTLSHKRPRETKPSPPEKLKDTAFGTASSKEEDEELQAALAASLEDANTSDAANGKDGKDIIKEEETCSSNTPEYPPLPEEAKGDRSMLCRVAVRFPDGRRAQRSFLKTDPIQILWSFCYSHLGEGEKSRPFRLAQAIPGASKSLDYDSKLTFGESGLANSIISITWD